MIDQRSRFLSRLLGWERQLPRMILRLTAYLGGALGMALLLTANRGWPVEGRAIGAVTAVCLAAIVLTRFHLRHSPTKGVDPRVAERIVWLVALLDVAGVQLIQRSIGPQPLAGIGFLVAAPLVAHAMLVSALLGPSIAIFSLTGVAFLVGLSGVLSAEAIASCWLAGAVASHAVNPLKHRADLLRATTIVTLAMTVMAFFITAVSEDKIQVVLESAGWAAVAAVGATSIFWLAVAVLERLFGILSDWSLLELCSPEHALIKQMCLRAPGTYAHSVMVGNLAEHAARDIGANPVLVRALAYYHDIGKLTRPSYFIENQNGLNPHDDIPATLSGLVIKSHVADGLTLGRQQRLPRVLLDGIEQHHGTTRIQYFYQQALKDRPDLAGDPAFESQFRYDGPRPQTREAAILLLADSVEAISRTFKHHTADEVEAAVARIIDDRRADGQLDECDLTLRDLQTIRRAFLRSLGALRHERVPYPDTPTYAPTAPNPSSGLEGLPGPLPERKDPTGHRPDLDHA